MNAETIIVATISTVGGIVGGAGGVEMVKAITGRKPKKVVAVDNEVKLAQEAANQAKAAAAYAQQMEQSARAAWQAAHDAEARVTQISREAQSRVDSVESKLDAVELRMSIVSRYTVWLVNLIREPDMTMEVLRVNVSKHRPPVGVMDGGE